MFEVVYNFLEEEGNIKEFLSKYNYNPEKAKQNRILHEAARCNPPVALFLSKRHGEFLLEKGGNFLTPLEYFDE